MPRFLPSMAIAATLAATVLPAQKHETLALHDGDRVVFYGDSITAQHLYTRFVEDIVMTRYPALKVTFYNAGMGGDRVTGGGAGPVQLRLDRDLFPLKPTVITIMLGMNDGGYKPDDPVTRQKYEDGYRSLVQKMKAQLPEARIYLIQPSPYDEITKIPKSPGYNAVLIGYGKILEQIAKDEHVHLIDGNTPIVDELQRAKGIDPIQAAHILPDSVHPQAPGHWVLASAIAQAWGVTPIVDIVTVNAKSNKAKTERATVADVATATDGSLSWTETDEALPLPLDPAQDEAKFLFKISDIAKMDEQILTVKDLPAAKYALTIDTTKVGDFTSSDLAAGVNLATQITPMTLQSVQMDRIGNDRANMDSMRFGLLYQGKDLEDRDAADRALRAFDALKLAQETTKAQPVPHTFHLTPAM